MRATVAVFVTAAVLAASGVARGQGYSLHSTQQEIACKSHPCTPECKRILPGACQPPHPVSPARPDEGSHPGPSSAKNPNNAAAPHPQSE